MITTTARTANSNTRKILVVYLQKQVVLRIESYYSSATFWYQMGLCKDHTSSAIFLYQVGLRKDHSMCLLLTVTEALTLWATTFVEPFL